MANPRPGRRHIMDLLRRERWSGGARLMKRLRRPKGPPAPHGRVRRRRIDMLAKARHMVDRWRRFYNHRRIQRALDKATTAAFAPRCLAAKLQQPPNGVDR